MKLLQAHVFQGLFDFGQSLRLHWLLRGARTVLGDPKIVSENIVKMPKPKSKKGKSAVGKQNAKQNSGNAVANKAKNGGKKK